MKTLRIALLQAGLLSILPLTLTAPAMAGFEWVPAPQSNTAPPPQKDLATPDPQTMPQVLIPMNNTMDRGDWDTPPTQPPAELLRATPEEPVPAGQPADINDINTPPPIIVKEEKMREEKPAPAANAETSWEAQKVDQQTFQPATPPRVETAAAPLENTGAFKTVEGFGSDMPLVLALQQVVPPQYSYSFGSGVQPGASASWSGGKAWNLVLQDMLKPLGLQATIVNNTVRLEKMSAPAAMSFTSKADAPVMADETTPRRKNIQDPGPVAAATAQDDLSDLPELVEMDSMDQPQPEPVLLNTQDDLAAIAAENKDMRMSEQVERSMQQENIEMRMKAEAAENFEDMGTGERPAGRPYSIEPYTPPGYMSHERTVSEKNAVLGNETRTGNQLSYGEDRMWEARRGDDLKETLVEWAHESNINLVWNARRDYTLSSNIMVNGDFRDALRTVVGEGLPVNNKPQVKLVDTPSGSNSTTFVVSDRS